MEYEKSCLTPSAERIIEAKYRDIKMADFTSDPLWIYLKTGKPVAFQELFIPMIAEARKRICLFADREGGRNDVEVSGILPYLSESALRSLEYGLLEFLSSIASKVLETEFSLFRLRYGSAFDRLMKGNESTEAYDSFIRMMYESGFIHLLKEYPLLLNLFATASSQWIDTTCELFSRLAGDFSAIADAFNGGAAPGIVKEIKCGLSDRHNGGHTVAILTFASGFRLVYKPRSLRMEEAWFRMLEQLNKKLSFDLFKCVNILNRETYGWMEFVEHIPCLDENEVRLHYRRAGALLCMVHCLRGTDCHCQNVIANGTYPVIIDLETLFHPYSRKLGINTHSSGNNPEDPEKYYSVMRTGLLPVHAFKQDGKFFDLSGFGSGIDKNQYPKTLKWVHMNTDSIRQEYAERDIPLPPNLPFTGDKVHAAKASLKELLDGFNAMYRFIQVNKKIFLGPNKLLRNFQAIRSRVVLRPTLNYYHLMQKALEPAALKSKEKISSLLASLSMNITYSGSAKSPDKILKEEEASLSKLDFPYFFTDTNGKFLSTCNGYLLNNLLPLSGMTEVVNYISHMNELDLEQQLYYIFQSFS